MTKFFNLTVKLRLDPEQFAPLIVAMGAYDIDDLPPLDYAESIIKLGRRKLNRIAAKAVLDYGIDRPSSMVDKANLNAHCEALIEKLKVMP